MDKAGAHTATIGSTPTEALQMPARMNPHENGFCRSLRLHEQREDEYLHKPKAHTALGTSAATKVALGIFSLVSLATNIKLPEHRINLNATFTEQVMNRFP